MNALCVSAEMRLLGTVFFGFPPFLTRRRGAICPILNLRAVGEGAESTAAVGLVGHPPPVERLLAYTT